MRSLSALYIDAGYLLHAAASRVAGTSLRSSVAVDYAGLIRSLADQASHLSGLQVLRTNWYDSGAGHHSGPDSTQTAIGMQPGVKLRLGRLSPNGDQKGVDVRMGLDLVTHARNNAVDVMYLVSGDDDLTEAVEEAQGHGVQVMLLSVPDQQGNPFGVSLHLRREADGLELIDTSVIDEHVRIARAEPAPKTNGTNGAGPNSVAASVTPGAPSGTPGRPVIPVPSPPPSAHPVPSPVRLPAAAPRPARPEPVYTTTTGQPGPQLPQVSLTETDGFDDKVDTVVRQALGAWRLSSTPGEATRLLGDRPYIPQALDRALLNDLSTSLGVYDLDEPTRVRLRHRFWEVATELL